MEINFSFIVPVFNRPREIGELLESMKELDYEGDWDIVIAEDGSTFSAEDVIAPYKSVLPISYLQKPNSGPGDTRNYAMARARGNYFILLDSDCLLPPRYLQAVSASLKEAYVDCYGGPDTAHESFSEVQKAISYAMTSVASTGGIRGHRAFAGNFQPRSYNMGLSRTAFEAAGGFADIHPGEDPDLVIRLSKLGFKTKLIPEAFVYHKRRSTFGAFYKQVYKFGMVRAVLNRWYPESRRWAYWFPTAFLGGMVAAIAALFFLPEPYRYWAIGVYALYFLLVAWEAMMRHNHIAVAFLAVVAVIVQLSGYGIGFIKSNVLLTFSGRKARDLFPELFY